MRSIGHLKADKLAWAQSLADKDQRKAWLDFYTKFWATEEGQQHLQDVLDGKLIPLDSPTKKS